MFVGTLIHPLIFTINIDFTLHIMILMKFRECLSLQKNSKPITGIIWTIIFAHEVTLILL